MTEAAPPGAPGALSNQAVIRRLLALAWQYRGACLLVMLLQIALLVMGIAGLGLFGLAIDCIRHDFD
ncbi:MAG: ABC transporter ATP-binding protein, partial [Planctomycetes bacterium]|nr:ABC transporter ATP-binding protein [Planctomycetota bacterium]